MVRADGLMFGREEDEKTQVSEGQANMRRKSK
jgi:hypothetical protein